MSGWRLAFVGVLMAATICCAGESAKTKPAELKVSGYGVLGNRQLKRTLATLLLEKQRPEFFDAAFVEDAALILVSQLNREGFLRPTVAANLELADGSRVSFLWDEPSEAPLPAGLKARRAHFVVREGIRFHYNRLEFIGLRTIKEKQARAFFLETGGILRLKRYRIYTPERLERGLRNVTETLERQGYANAKAAVARQSENDGNGDVDVVVEIDEGPEFTARSVVERVYFGANETPTEVRTNFSGKPFSRIWSQDYAQMLRTNYYVRGYPDTTVSVEVSREEASNGIVHVDLTADVRPGERVRVGKVEFTGNKKTRESVLDRRVALEPGDWLDRVKAEKGRLRLSRLGIFESVELAYDPIDEQTRNVTYRLREGKRIDFSLLFGYGSYELLRAGFELEQRNVFGRAHHSRLKAVQSFKSSSATYTYTMPELLGEDWDVFLRGFGLRREEVSFTRLEYGGGAGVQRALRKIDSTLALRYDYQLLNAIEADIDVSAEGVENPAVGAVTVDFRHDRRNNPLYPERGYKIFSNLELASEYLAGDVNYQRFELAAAYHWPLDNSRRLNLGLGHGLIAAVGSPQEDLPFTRRFFPGGENSVRGYQEGEAGPRNEDGDVIGAETYLLATVEFEQALTPRWSLVVFSDNLGAAEQLDDYPGRRFLHSVGGGLRWRTVIGPVRLEYGHNLNPREDDPSGTLHFSLGFPF